MKSRVFLTIFFLISFAYQSTLFGQYYFGRNKIQYNNFDWKVLKTEHFDVFFYPQMRELAEIGAAFAEEAYHRLESQTDHNILRRIPLIFYSNHSHFQQTNTIPSFLPENTGGFFEFIKGRVVIPARGSIPEFKHVINHEMVHVFTRTKMNRVLRNHRKPSHAGMPLWFTEGIAEYWSEGWSSQAEMILRDAVLSGYLVPLQEMDTIYGSYLMYKEGQAICKYIAEKFGKEKLLQLIENTWKEGSFSDVMKLTIGLSYAEFDEKWTYDLRKAYYPDLRHRDSPRMKSKAITSEGLNTKPAPFNLNDQSWVAFVANRVGYSNIYLQSLEDQTEHPNVLVKGERTPEFESFHLLNSKIDVNAYGELTFVSKSGSRDVIYIFDISERVILKEFDFQDLVTLSSPSWSPDGKRIVFSGTNFAGVNDLYVVEEESGELQRLTHDFYDDRDPAWSPKGDAVAFSSDRSREGQHGFLNLFLYKFSSGSIVPLSNGKHNDYAPAWSPDGGMLAFSSDRDGAFNIWLIKNGAGRRERRQSDQVFVASTERNLSENFTRTPESATTDTLMDYPSALDKADFMKKLTNFTTGAFDPVWQDDGKLLFTAFEDFSFQIHQIEKVDKTFTEAALVQSDTLVDSVDPWVAAKLAGDVESTTIRYKKKFSLDIAQSAISQDPVFGLNGGAQLAVSDVLGNQQYYFLLYNNAQTGGDFWDSWNIAVTRVELSRRLNYAIGGYRLRGRFYDQKDSFFDQSQLGGFVAASYPFTTFRRLEGSLNIRHERRTFDFKGEAVNGIVWSSNISYVQENSLWGVTGPIDGERFNFTVGHTIDVQNNDVNFFTLSADYRRYFRLSPRMTYAVRLLTRINQGKEAFRYFMGGSWDLRLYPRWTIWGRKLFLVSQELRMPFLDRFLLNFPFGNLGFRSIRGAAFVDLGQAWDQDYQLDDVLGSIGFGWRLRVGGFLVLRYEIGRTFRLRNLNSPALDFDKGLKKAFWFGFDF
ncbi:MAG: peptidase MA family metallohydrolase [bacterium]